MIKLQKWVASDGGWWMTLPYTFDTLADANAFLLKLDEANPGQPFRVMPTPT